VVSGFTRVCAHSVTEPVALSTGEIVRHLCVDCLVEVPAEWGCIDCEWEEISAFGMGVIRRTLVRRCDRHA